MTTSIDELVPRIRDLASETVPLANHSDLISALPKDHQRFLAQYLNGGAFQRGYLRLFGAGRNDALDIDQWNSASGWKSCWPSVVQGFICFAETMWRDQFAYSAQSLSAPEAVYMLGSDTMKPTLLALSFAQFLEFEVLGDFGAFPDLFTTEAVEKFGSVPVDSHVVFVPSPLIGGEQRMTNAMLIPAVDAMSTGGDIARYGRENPEIAPKSITPYYDAAGLARLRFN